MKRRILLWISLLLLAASLWDGKAAEAGTVEFEQANRLYEEGRYLEAIDGYQQLMTNGVSSPLHFNLGNAFFKSGQLGEAIAQYLKAESIDRRDPDVLANLKFARAKVDGRSYQPGWLEQSAQKLSIAEWSLLTSSAIWLCFGLLIISQFRPDWKNRLRIWTVLSAVLAVAFTACLVWIARAEANTRVAVVTDREAVVRMGPFEESQSAMTLKDGAELKVLDEKDGWIQVTAGQGQSGWIQSGAVVTLP